MGSIALFPCSYTNGATIIGELISSLHLKVYTDEMLFSEVSEQFGISAEKLKKNLFGRLPTLNRYLIKKKKIINCLKCSLGAQLRSHPKDRLHYGLHTCLLDSQNDLVLKVLVFDDEESRVTRATQQEGFTEKTARDHVQMHDKKVFDWTNFLFHKEAYDRSLYDFVLDLNHRHPIDIAQDITAVYRITANLESLFPAYGALPVLENQPNMGEHMSWVG